MDGDLSEGVALQSELEHRAKLSAEAGVDRKKKPKLHCYL